ncbi:MAG: MFS transporter [Roseiflexaceae bacterium]|nr:MFS transporter [Chloroflexaceae bacterium]
MKDFVQFRLPILSMQISNFFSGLSNAVVMITIPWLTLEVTGSPAFSGLVIALSAVPSLVVAPFGGMVITRYGSKAVSMFADIMSALSVLIFALLALTGNLSAVAILVCTLLGAIFDPLGYTARRTMIQPISEQTNYDIQRLNGIHEGLIGTSWIVGPAVGAWCIALIGAANSFWVVCVLFLISAFAVAFLRDADLRIAVPESHEHTSTVSELSLGFRRLWGDNFLRTLLLAVFVLAAIYLPTESIILPTYFESMNMPLDLGIVISALAAGSTMSAFAYGWLVQRISSKILIRVAFIGASLGTVGMAFLPSFGLMVLFALILGFSWGPISPLLNAKIQARFPAHEHPMVFSAQISVFYAAPPIGMLLVGFGVETFGLSPTYFFLATTMLIVSVLALLSKSMRTDS